MVLIICGIYLNCPLLFLILFLYCVYFCCSRQFKLVFVIGFCSLFIVPRLLTTLDKIDHDYTLKQEFILKVSADSLKINGDNLSFHGENQRGEVFSCYYTFQSETEKSR